MIIWPCRLWCYILKIHNNNYLKFDKKMINNILIKNKYIIKLSKLKKQAKPNSKQQLYMGLKIQVKM